MTDVGDRKQRLEEQKVALDYVKHVSTLSTSVLVFCLAFSDQLKQPSWSWLYIPGLGCQLVCLVAMVIAAVGAISAGRSIGPPSSSVVRLTVWSTLIGLMSFLIGICAIGAFLIKNLI